MSVFEAKATTITHGSVYGSRPLKIGGPADFAGKTIIRSQCHAKLLKRHRNVYTFQLTPVDTSQPITILTFPRRKTNRKEKRRERKRKNR